MQCHKKPSQNWWQVKIYLFEGFYECNGCETGYDKGKGNYCLDIDECYTVGCDDYDEGLELLCTNTEGDKRSFILDRSNIKSAQ